MKTNYVLQITRKIDKQGVKYQLNEWFEVQLVETLELFQENVSSKEIANIKVVKDFGKLNNPKPIGPMMKKGLKVIRPSFIFRFEKDINPAELVKSCGLELSEFMIIHKFKDCLVHEMYFPNSIKL